MALTDPVPTTMAPPPTIRSTETPAPIPSLPAPRLQAHPHPHPHSQPQPLARFSMTSDLRAATGLTRTHLDFYLREGLIVPTARTESGYLLFDDAEVARLRDVIRWRRDGLGIREIRARLGR